LEHDPSTALLDRRQRVLIDYVLKLTLAPRQMTEHDLALLREVNFSDSAIHDAVAIAAYFNFVNRIASGLGVELE
jgi:uncharacterized peroxidase-related enzyme